MTTRTKFCIYSPWEVSGVFLQPIQFYLERLRQRGSCDHHVLKTEKNSEASEEKVFGQLIGNLRKAHTAVVCLDERGKDFTSQDLAKWISDTQLKGHSTQAFVLGGAYGLPAVLAEDPLVLPVKLSSLTLPHELALLVLAEQLYRAQCILSNHPYHHGEASAFSKARSKGRI